MMQIVMDGRNVMQEFVKENTLKFSGENKINRIFKIFKLSEI